MSKYKFVARGEGDDFDAAVFYNGQKMIHIFMGKSGDEFEVQVEDGSGALMGEWNDFEESD